MLRLRTVILAVLVFLATWSISWAQNQPPSSSPTTEVSYMFTLFLIRISKLACFKTLMDLCSYIIVYPRFIYDLN